ncbi:MAG: acyloxyacyl hydrolase [Bacteroidota bacterium]
MITFAGMSRVVIILLLVTTSLFGQNEEPKHHFADAHYYYGTLLRHNKNVSHLVTDHPQGFIFGYNWKTRGEKYWQESYNYPDWGISLLYQDMGNEALGRNYGIYGHFNFYFLNRNLQLRLAQGIAYNTNPFDINTNFKNISYGSDILISSYFLLNYKKENILNGLGVQGGLAFVHSSNGSFRAPNSGTNIVALNLGLVYNVDHEREITYLIDENPRNYNERITYNFVLRGGVNEGDFFNLGQHPFLVLSAFADKRFNYQSTVQLGVEVFFSKFLEKEIEYLSIAFDDRLNGDEDYKRVSVFVGHEFRLGKFAIPTQVGYYIYWPYEYESRVYQRLGVKYYFNEKIFGVSTVKVHGANAEAIEFGVGIRL